MSASDIAADLIRRRAELVDYAITERDGANEAKSAAGSQILASYWNGYESAMEAVLHRLTDGTP